VSSSSTHGGQARHAPLWARHGTLSAALLLFEVAEFAPRVDLPSLILDLPRRCRARTRGMLVQVRNYKFRSLPLIYNYLRPIKDTDFCTHTDTRSRAWNAGAPTPAAPPPLSVRPTGRTSSGEDTRAQTLTDTADNRDTRTGRRPGGTQTLPVTPRPIALPQLGSPNRLCIRGHGQKCVSISLISPQLHVPKPSQLNQPAHPHGSCRGRASVD
jgi:hypothetical protein